MNIHEAAGLTGISVRTLHHYDQIGLLQPDRNPENGYREYSEKDLDLLQQILFFKECGFSLAVIRKLLSAPSFDREKAFALQKKMLLHEKERIEAMLGTLEKSRKAMKGEITITQEEKFGGFDMSRNPYEKEARRLYGEEAVDQSKAHFSGMSKEEKNAVAHGMDALFSELASIRTQAPGSEPTQKAMEKMYRHFNENLGYHYTPRAFAGVGQLYVTDPRFTENVDRYGEGLSRFLAEAMRIFAEKKK